MRRIWLAILWICLAPPALAATPGETLEQAIAAYAGAQEATARNERLAGFR